MLSADLKHATRRSFVATVAVFCVSTTHAQHGQSCDRCSGAVLDGRHEISLEVPYRIDSDLPEMFTSTGVLYTTRDVLPPFLTKSGGAVAIEQRKQRNLGFRSIDGSFEVFLYHLSYAGEAPRNRRIVVYASNVGERAVSLNTSSMIESSGTMAKADGPESRLAVRSLESRWDPVKRTMIPAGKGQVIAWTPRISDTAAAVNDPDRSTSDFVTGLVRGIIEKDSDANLEISVIAVPGETEIERLTEVARGLLETGARSAEDMDLNIPPPECHVRRVSGVSRNFLWRSENAVIDVSTLSREPMKWTSSKGETRVGPRGLAYLMTAPKVQTSACPQARQTMDMLLHPGYVHSETIGNYQTEYLVTLTLENPNEVPELVDVRFGKFDADIGVAWQFDIGDTARTREELGALPAHVQWAGAWRTDDLADDTRSFFAPADSGDAAHEAPLVVGPKSRTVVSLRFVPVGTSSMPFMLFVVPSER